ncbi:uncharacterized protein LOC116016025 [Ipomoea triloba]|uniref:uncharacterized protein LOC116016025 n=1 Tax=Ipomoea triloba TaxID=35885 RepID=UPI00125DFA21|nr:uncharacterized protein LOC116016025 [Ipomoea triloba]
METQRGFNLGIPSATKHITFLFASFLLLLLLFHIHFSPFDLSSSPASHPWMFPDSSGVVESLTTKLKQSVTFMPLKDLRFAQTAMTGNTWFMSSLNDTHEKDEAQHLYFPSDASQGRLLCVKGRNIRDGTQNSYALAWRSSLPFSATLLEGLTFISDSYYSHENLWHGLCAVVPFVRWAMRNGCVKPQRWVLFHWGEIRYKMGSWVRQLMETEFGDVEVERFKEGDDDGPYCFERAVVMRHDMGEMGIENKLKAFDLLRCKARNYCGFMPESRREVDDRGFPIIRLTLLMRRGSRSFKNAAAVTDIFAEECAKVDGCVLNVAQSEDLSFCDQVRVMTNTDIVASPHGAQLTNMFFMDRGSSVMEFFPKGWREYSGIGRFAHHWMATQSGMNHRGAWWDPNGPDCPNPKDSSQCFSFHKNGKVGHNQTYFAEWASKVLNQVKLMKMEKASKTAVNTTLHASNACAC